MKVKQATFYKWKYRHYFTAVEEGDKNMRVECKLCAPSIKTLSSASNTTSNLIKHSNTVHKATPLVPFTPEKRKSDENEESYTLKMQCTLPSIGKLNPTRLRNMDAKYVIEDMLPLSTVESPAFKKLVCGMPSSNAQLPKIFHLVFGQGL